MTDLFRGLPRAVRDALAAPPDQEHALLELALAWPGLDDAEARVAGRLRVFVLTSDLLSWLELRSGPAWATVNGAGETFEVVLYIPLEHALDIARWNGGGVLEVLAALGESAVTIGARCEALLASGAYPRLAERGETDLLLSDAGVDLPKARAPLRLGLPAVSLTSGGWEPIGLGVIHDLVAEAFGPVDLDRSPVRLRVRSHSATCPACAGRAFGFPAELEEQRAAMCPPHAREAREVADARLDRAAKSNPEGWDAFSQACRRLEEAPLPWDLRQRLHAALGRGHDGWPGRDADPAAKAAFAEQIRGDAELVMALAEHYEKHPDRFDELLEELGWAADDWLMNIPFILGSAGLADLVAPVGDALGRLDPAHARMYASDAAVVLAEAGRAGEALARAEANLRAWPDDLWTRIHLGDVHASLSDPEQAEEQYRHAVAMARAGGELSDVNDAYDRLVQFLSDRPDRQADLSAARTEHSQWKRHHRARTKSSARPRRPPPAHPEPPPPTLPPGAASV